MTLVAFTAKVDLIIGGRVCPPSMHARLAQGESEGPGRVTRFFLGAWVGAGSREFSLSPIAPDGTATVRLRLHGEGKGGGVADVDTIKLAVSFNIATPKGGRNCALASSYIPVDRLLGLLAAGGSFGAGEDSLCMRDNFTRNTAVLRFRNLSTNLPAARALRLRPSSLHLLDRTGAAVCAMGNALHDTIQTFAVSPLNAGPQYIEPFTYWHMQKGLSSYALLGHLMSTLPTPVDLHWLMYDAYQAVQSTGLRPAELARLPPDELVLRFALPMISRHTACALTSMYTTDYTLSDFVPGQAIKLRETEDIGLTFGSMALHTQGLAQARPFASSLPGGALPPLGKCISLLVAEQERRRAHGVGALLGAAPDGGGTPGLGIPAGPRRPPAERGLSNNGRVSFAAIADDCENCTQGLMHKAKGLLEAYLALLPPGAPADAAGLRALDAQLAPRLAERMAQAAARSRLFAAIGPEHHAAMAPLLVALGRMLHTGEWDNNFTVCSAKGASYREDDPNCGGELSGHGTLLASVVGADGVRRYAPVEGTSYFRAEVPPPPGYAQDVVLHCADGSALSLPFDAALTVIGQNAHEILGLGPDCSILAHLSTVYKDVTKTPFYKDVFYISARRGERTLCCVPLDTQPPAAYGAGQRPLFGAPVMGLALPTTVALPVGIDLLGETPEQQDEVHALLCEQISEMYSPPTDKVDVLSSFWQPCASPDALPAPLGAPFYQTECCYAYDHPDHTSMAVAVLRAVADRFNALQAKEPGGDGVVASAFGQYLSATFALRLPTLRSGAADRPHTTFRNLRLAVSQIGSAQLSACPMKREWIRARASVPSQHHFYMCTQGNGPVHAHSVRLA
jgi:hypothetical protein